MENKYPYIGKYNGMIGLLTSKGYGICLSIQSSKYGEWVQESKLKNITADYLRNTKIRIESPEHSVFVQKLVFGAGGGWGFGHHCLLDGLDFLFISEALRINKSDSESLFNHSSFKEIKLPMPPSQLPEVSSETLMPKVKPPKQASDEWPRVGDEVFFGVGYCDSGVVLCKYGDYLWIRTIDADAGGPMFVTKKTSSLKKPQAPLDILADLLIPIVSANSRETSGYAAEQIAKAILAGEIEGLVYKGG